VNRGAVAVITTLALGILTAPLVGEAEKAGESYRISFLALTPGEDTTLMKAFLERLHELGYSEGKNMTFEYRSGEGRPERAGHQYDDGKGVGADDSSVSATAGRSGHSVIERRSFVATRGVISAARRDRDRGPELVEGEALRSRFPRRTTP
jgi:hypothetical protein